MKELISDETATEDKNSQKEKLPKINCLPQKKNIFNSL